MTRYRKQFRSNKTRQQLCSDVSLKFHLTPKKTQGKLETSASDKSLSDAEGEQGESSEAGSVVEEGRFGGWRWRREYIHNWRLGNLLVIYRHCNIFRGRLSQARRLRSKSGDQDSVNVAARRI
ncbi:hypothetical protein HNY73_019933 [Argiope bruennichi]|uniref:Uncharacterized protein n=1 Tax=Argiope bruennichi TaxID=94029 RepID=A0A8T0E9J4_ARGBR|nr:hypothetical protein HNY73_019933 [Argiope bruennichi]